MSTKKEKKKSISVTRSAKGHVRSQQLEAAGRERSDTKNVQDTMKLTFKYSSNTGKERMVRGSEYYFLPDLKKGRVSYVFREVNPLLNYLGYTQGDSSKLLETDPSTISRWKNSKKSVDIGKLRSKVLINLDEIIAKGVRIFGNEELFLEWLHTTNYALGDIKPIDLLKDVYSMELVEEALDALSWGDYL